jgi:hypothetical protein
LEWKLDDQIQFRCNCGASLRAPLSAAGRTGTCRNCGTRVIIPVLAESVKEAERVAGGSRGTQDALGNGHSTDDSRWPPGANAQGSSDNSAWRGPHNSPKSPDVRSATEVLSPPPHPQAKHANNSSVTPSAAHTTVEATTQLCSICQTPIQVGDPSTSCDECHLPFHVECWEENLGCSAYGCSNVNALRTGPDIQITSPPPLAARPLDNFSNNSPPAQSDIPWEYLLLAASALGSLLGLLCFGGFALMAGSAAALYFVANGKDQPTAVLAASLAMSVIGVIMGLILSASFWW